MDIFSIFFALIVMVAGFAATLTVGMIAGVGWGVALFGLMLFGIFWTLTGQDEDQQPIKRDHLNAFQQPLADD